MKLLTNCPNCGAPLTSDGYCFYCNTKVRYANEVEYQTFLLNGCITDIAPTEIYFKFKADDGTLIVLPFVGKPENIEIECNSIDYVGCAGNILGKTSIVPTIRIEMVGNIDRKSVV